MTHVASVPARTSRRTARTVLTLFVCLAAGDARAQLALDVNAAIERGVERLLAAQRDDGTFAPLGADPGSVPDYPDGTTAFALYTLRKSGVPPTHACFERGLAALLPRPLVHTYSVSVLVLLLDALGDPAHDARIDEAAGWLEERLDERTGLWPYPDREPDLSNTQFAALALRAAAHHGHETPPKLWADLVQGVLRRQASDGGYSYHPLLSPEPSGTMTTAGLTTLFVAREALEAAGRHDKERALADKSTATAWDWLDARFSPSGGPLGHAGVIADRYPAFGRAPSWHYYMLYGIERVASLYDRRSIGDMPWYRDGALEILGHESPEGGWGTLENTCFALLFLRRATISGGATQATSDATRVSVVTLPRASDAADEGATWAYTTDEPPRAWTKPSFDDTTWERGSAGFGSPGSNGLTVRTVWSTVDLWARRAFEWTPADGPLRVWAIHDDGLEVWIDGEQAFASPVFSQGSWVEYEISKAARRAVEAGTNVVAAHVHDTGGARAFDLRFSPPVTPEILSDHWRASLPHDDVPFVRRWIVRGPLDDRTHEQLLSRESPLVLPAGRKVSGLAWTEHRHLSAGLDLVDALRLDAREVAQAAFTFTCDAPLDGWLWLGASGGLRAWIDGRPALLHHEHGRARPDALRVRLALPAGEHVVALAAERWDDEALLFARVAASDGAVVPGLRLHLPDDADDGPRALVAQPDGRSDAELLAGLPPASPATLRFDRAEDVDAIAFVGAIPGSPRWIAKVDRKALGEHPPVGARGVLALRPSDAGRPARLLARVELPAGATTLVARLAAPVDLGRGARATLVASDGETSARATCDVLDDDARAKVPWTRLTLDVGAFAGRPVLVTLEVEPLPGFESLPLFVDALELE
ncbi:MAG: terpene cyclase/mutase family protein [Planctomycetes bacterium]|nr:terpene cyclase/mutase family protein [Planctomycetota bacterium]